MSAPRKQEKDYGPEVKALVPEAESLAKVRSESVIASGVSLIPTLNRTARLQRPSTSWQHSRSRLVMSVRNTRISRSRY